MIRSVSSVDVMQAVKSVAKQNSREISPSDFAQKVDEVLIESRRPAIPVRSDYISKFVDNEATNSNSIKKFLNKKWRKVGVAVLATLFAVRGIWALINNASKKN